MCAGACAGAEAGPQNQNGTSLMLPSMGGVLQSSETWAVITTTTTTTNAKR